MTAAWDASPRKICLIAARRAPFYPALTAMVLVRGSMWAYRRRLTPLAHLLKARAIRVAGVEVHPKADIGPGFAFVHSVGIVIGADVVAGRDLVVHQGVTIGNRGADPGQPVIGDGVRIGAGALVLGAVQVGDGARIGAGAVVLADVPAGEVVTGTWTSHRLSDWRASRPA